ncbi:MAG: hypothetical protein WC804_19510 [Sphingomonas sp.]
MLVLRTPEERFTDLADYSFVPHYLTITDADSTDIRIHSLDEGPRGAAPVLERFDKPVLTAFSDQDVVTRDGERAFIDHVPGARHQPHRIVTGGGHFLQEDAPEELCTLIEQFIRIDTGVWP